MPSILISDVQVSGRTMTVKVNVRPGTASLFSYEGEVVVMRRGGDGVVRKNFSGSSSGSVETKNVTIDMSQFSAVQGEKFLITSNLLEPVEDSYQLEVEVLDSGTSEDPVTGGGGSGGGGGNGGNGVGNTGLSAVQIAAGLGAVAGSAYLADRYMK